MAKNNKAGKTAKKAPWSTKIMFKALPDDIIIPVMGPTGAGKSTFINYLAKDSVEVGHGLKSCTVELQPVVITSSQHPQLGGQRLVMVDTPGFDDTYVWDSDILCHIALWLATAYNSDMKLGGVIYLHDISLSRMLGTTRKNLKVLQKLCGDDAFRTVILGTTGWIDSCKEDGDMRTQQLRDNYWRDMLDCGSKIFKFEDSSKSAWTLVDSILELNRNRAEVLQIRRELTYQTLQDDIIIPVMGPTGVGKSTFINYLARGSVKVGHDLNSCTTELHPVVITYPQPGGQRLVMVDTPGFDDTYMPDSEILRRIALWLATAYNSDMKLGGVIYLHDISQSRMLGTTHNLEVVQKLCGDDVFQSVILGTTKWGYVFEKDGDMRTQQLRDNYWRDMVDRGSKILKFEDSSKSAWTMVDSIVQLNRSRAEILQIQRELADTLKLIPDTEPGQKLRNDLDQVLKKLREDRKAQKKGESQRLELDYEITQLREQMKSMQVPVSQRVLSLLSLGIDKILNPVPLSPPAPESSITRLAIDCDRLVLLFGESRDVKNMLLKLLSAQGLVEIGSDQNALTQEIKCWSVGTSEETSIIIDTPDFDSSSNPGRVVQKTRTWLESLCRRGVELGVIYLKPSGLDPSTHQESPPTKAHNIDGSPSGTGAVSLQTNNLPTPAAFSRVTPPPNEPTLSLTQSLSNRKLVSNVPTNLPTARQSPSDLPVISLTDSRPSAPPKDRKTNGFFPPSTASISPPEKDVRPSSITRRSYDTSSLAAPKEQPPTTIVLGDEGITSATTVGGHQLSTKQPVSPGFIPGFLPSKRPHPTPSLTPLPAGIARSSLSAMELFQGLPSADTIIFATLTTRPKKQTSEEASAEADVMPNYASDGKVIEFQNTPEAAQAMLHLSLEKTLSVRVLLDALVSLDGDNY